MSFVAKVKNVVSADTFVLVPSKSTQVPIPERLLTLSYVRGDLFVAKEEIRKLLIGKDVKFKVFYKTPSGKEFGDIQTPIFQSLIEHGLEKGWFKIREGVDESDEYVDELKLKESKARSSSVGVWSTTPENISSIEVDDAIIAKSKKSPIFIIIDKVISGDRVMARILVNGGNHIVGPLLLAGIKAPRTDEQEGTSVTKVAHQAKEFVESKLLTTTVALRVELLGLSQSGIPIGNIIHPSGNNIAEKLLEQGLAEIVDWQSTIVGSAIMGQYRRAEQQAKALAKGLYASSKPAAAPATATVAGSNITAKSLRVGSKFDATIARVISPDTLLIRLPNDEEVTVQLASLRGPRPNDSQLTSDVQERTALINTAKEYVRTLAIGKVGTVYIDGQRKANPDLGLEERFLVSIQLNSNKKDLGEIIVQHGWASVIKHNKATSHERSLNWDKLVELEQEQIKLAKNGIYYKGPNFSKVLTVGTRIVDASENLTKAKTFFNGFRQKGRISGGYYVEFIPSMNRVKLFNPKEGLKLTLILGGLTNSRDEQLSEEGLKYMNKKFLQRSVEFEVYDQDKIGGFIGNLFATSKSLTPVQTQLLEQGFTKTHEIALNSNTFAAQLKKAEQEGQNGKKGIWSNYDPQVAAAQADAEAAARSTAALSLNEAPKAKFFDIEVTDVDSEGIITFQLIDFANKNKFETFKKQFADFHSQNPSASQSSVDLPHNLTKPPKKGDLVSAKFSENSKYYRGRVVSFDKASNKYEVKHVDFGNIDFVALSSLRVLPQKFGLQQIPQFAHTCLLQNLRLPPSSPTDYRTDALYALEDLCYDKKLVISSVPNRAGVVEYDGVLYDAEESLKDPTYTINKELVRKGWAVVDVRKTGIQTKEYDSEMLQHQRAAKAGHAGCWEFGDVQFDEDLE